MPNSVTPIVQLVTRIPRALRRRVKVHCLMNETTLTHFVVQAIHDRLEAEKPSRQNGTARAAAR